MFLKINSAIGLRQILPKQTKHTRIIHLILSILEYHKTNYFPRSYAIISV